MPEPITPHMQSPVYVQVADRLERDIAAGRLIDGERLAPERIMAQSLEISVGTLRKALGLLEDKGLLQRVQGSGNYVTAAGMRDTVYAMFRLELPGGGGLPRADILSVERVDKPTGCPDFGHSPAATRIRRRRWLDDVQIAMEEIWLDSRAGELRAEQVLPSLYQTYHEQLGLWISRAEDRVGVAPLPDWTHGAFHLSPKVAVGYIERLSWSDETTPIEFSRTWFDPIRAQYVQRIK